MKFSNITNLEIFAEIGRLTRSKLQTIAITDSRLQTLLHRSGVVEPDIYLQGVMFKEGGDVITIVFSKTQEIDLGFATAHSNECGLRHYDVPAFLQLLGEARRLPAPARGPDELAALSATLGGALNS